MFQSYLWGCFYLIHNRNPGGSPRLLLRALGAWAAASLVLLPLAALLLSRLRIGSAAIGYWSSGLSFLAAFYAGLTAGDKRKDGSLSTCVATGFLLIILLLTVGYLVKGSLDPSGILSVVSFTFAGVLFGGLTAGGKRKGRRRNAFSLHRA